MCRVSVSLLFDAGRKSAAVSPRQESADSAPPNFEESYKLQFRHHTADINSSSSFR